MVVMSRRELLLVSNLMIVSLAVTSQIVFPTTKGGAMTLKKLLAYFVIILGSLVLSGYTGFPETTGRGPEQFRASVRDNHAEFIFPVHPKKEYTWCLSGTTFLWNVEVKDNAFNIQYRSGYPPYSQGDPRCKTGKLQEMLLHGGTSVYKMTGNLLSAMPRVLVEHELSADGKQLILKLWDAAAIKEIFSRKPKQVVFQWELLDEKSSKRIAVDYPSGADPATARTTSQLIGKWSTPDSQNTIEYRKDNTWSSQSVRDGKGQSGKWTALDKGRIMMVDGRSGDVISSAKIGESALSINGIPFNKSGYPRGAFADATDGSFRTPTQAAKDFVSAVTKGDAIQIAKVVSKHFTEMVNQQGGLARLASEGRNNVEARGGYTIVNVEGEVVTGSTAEVTFKSIRGKETRQETDRFFLVKENGTWKINGFSW